MPACRLEPVEHAAFFGERMLNGLRACNNQLYPTIRLRHHHCTNDGCARCYTLPVRYLPATNNVLSEEDSRLQIVVHTCCGVGARLYATCSKKLQYTQCFVKVKIEAFSDVALCCKLMRPKQCDACN